MSAPQGLAACMLATLLIVGAESRRAMAEECLAETVAPGPAQSGLENLQASMLAIFRLRGFKCEVPSAGAGLSCIGRLKGYPRDVLIVVPPGYQPRASAEIVLHLHGHNYSNFDAVGLNQHFGLASGLVSSKRNAILIAPLSKGNCTDFEQSLVDKPEHFKSFIDESMALFKEAKLSESGEPGALTLTSHSGSYRSIAKILRSGVYTDKITELYAFDATYELAGVFAAFAAKPGNRYWSAHVDPAVVSVAEKIQARLEEQGVPYFSGKGLKGITPGVLKANPVGFVRSAGGHDETFSKYFPAFLAYKP